MAEWPDGTGSDGTGPDGTGPNGTGSNGTWLIEHGIGEERALLLDGEQVVAAKLYWPPEMRAGDFVSAKLVSKPAGSQRGLAKTERGHEVLVKGLPRDATEGSAITVLIHRAPIAERGRLKRAQGSIADAVLRDSPRSPEGKSVHRFPAGLWEDVWQEASTASVEFAGGSLLISVTPAMTLIDIDGDGSPRDLALSAVPAIAHSLHQFDLGGSIGIDFPTIANKAGRREVDAALEQALDGWQHERTAMNGFGFVQIVARLEGPSLLHRFATSRVGACARVALRRAEMAEGTGAVCLLRIHPALKAKLKPEWLEEATRRIGKQLRIETDPALALEAPQAQIVPL